MGSGQAAMCMRIVIHFLVTTVLVIGVSRLQLVLQRATVLTPPQIWTPFSFEDHFREEIFRDHSDEKKSNIWLSAFEVGCIIFNVLRRT